jgi:hypothetical protein
VTQTLLSSPLLSSSQRQAFERDGVLRFEGLLSPERVLQAREAVLRPLEQLGLRQDGRWRLEALPRPTWPESGPKTAHAIGHKHPELRSLAADPSFRAIVDELLEGAALDRALGPQVLFTLPNADAWTAPYGWHVDLPRLASGRLPGVQLFTFLEPVAPCGGGTVVILGSHRLLNGGRHIRSKDVKRLLCSEPFFRELYADPKGTASDPAELLGRRARINGVELSLIELTGAPGDAWLIDLRAVHAGAPNVSDRPRLMMTQRYVRADVAGELAEAYGWV